MNRIVSDPITPAFTGPLASLPARPIAPWRQTWLKPRATQLASSHFHDREVPLIASWSTGAGKALATAYHPDPATIDLLADTIAMPPRDPRFTISWETSSTIHVRIDAADNGVFLNDLDLQLLTNSADPAQPIPQTGPGRYELTIPSPREPTLLLVRTPERILMRLPVPGRYAPEFDRIGNNRPAMAELARRTNGRVIEPDDSAPIVFPSTTRVVALTPWLSIIAAVLLAAGLLRLRR